MRKLVGIAVAMALLSAGADAGAQGGGQAVVVRGSCGGLTVFGTDWTGVCIGSLTNAIHANGVQSLIFSAGDRALVTFTGREQTMTDGGRTARLRIDGVTVAPMQPGARHAAFRVAGECRFGNPFAGPMHAVCTAAAPEGQFAADFTTDGGRPEVTRF